MVAIRFSPERGIVLFRNKVSKQEIILANPLARIQSRHIYLRQSLAQAVANVNLSYNKT